MRSMSFKKLAEVGKSAAYVALCMAWGLAFQNASANDESSDEKIVFQILSGELSQPIPTNANTDQSTVFLHFPKLENLRLSITSLGLISLPRTIPIITSNYHEELDQSLISKVLAMRPESNPANKGHIEYLTDRIISIVMPGAQLELVEIVDVFFILRGDVDQGFLDVGGPEYPSEIVARTLFTSQEECTIQSTYYKNGYRTIFLLVDDKNDEANSECMYLAIFDSFGLQKIDDLYRSGCILRPGTTKPNLAFVNYALRKTDQLKERGASSEERSRGNACDFRANEITDK